ncbi:MAG: hypothetical protein INR65_03220 [Gluconacetobacter diazotrophicus]|nr:hypothetical protein [Gluconacetobacter diazotrophicus]
MQMNLPVGLVFGRLLAQRAGVTDGAVQTRAGLLMAAGGGLTPIGVILANTAIRTALRDAEDADDADGSTGRSPGDGQASGGPPLLPGRDTGTPSPAIGTGSTAGTSGGTTVAGTPAAGADGASQPGGTPAAPPPTPAGTTAGGSGKPSR